MKTTVPVEIPLHLIVPHAESIAQKVWVSLEWVGLEAMGHQVMSVHPVMLKAVSGIFCLVTLAGYAWVKGWGSCFYEPKKQPKREDSEDTVPSEVLFSVNPKADVVDAYGLSSLTSKLLELSGKHL